LPARRGVGAVRLPHYVYILASRRNGTLYVGMTNNIARRMHEHRSGAVPGFTSRYAVTRLVYVETHDDPRQAIQREHTIKHWRRSWKLALIERDNPAWDDLYERLLG